MDPKTFDFANGKVLNLLTFDKTRSTQADLFILIGKDYNGGFPKALHFIIFRITSEVATYEYSLTCDTSCTNYGAPKLVFLPDTIEAYMGFVLKGKTTLVKINIGIQTVDSVYEIVEVDVASEILELKYI